jgi:hypothetical protein
VRLRPSSLAGKASHSTTATPAKATATEAKVPRRAHPRILQTRRRIRNGMRLELDILW